MQLLVLFGVLASTYLLMFAKRMPALIRSFRYQSFFLFLITLLLALQEKRSDLYIISGLLFTIKVAAIPQFLYYVIKKLKVKEDIGLFINSQLSLLWALGFTYLSWLFAQRLVYSDSGLPAAILTVAIFMVLAGVFLMILRMTALAQIIGLLVMENGLFLTASTVSGGMPFFVEIAIFFDVFVSVVIMGSFLYRINKLFTHIDVNKLSRLKG